MRLYQRLLMLASACLTAIVGTLAISPSAMAAPPAAGYYMMVNDAYPTKCLSANNSTPPGGGAGTYMVYLADCNPNTLAQWWTLPPQYDLNPYRTMKNYSSARCLSTNFSTPEGGGAGTHAAYTTACGSDPQPDAHLWGSDNTWYTDSKYKYKLINGAIDDGAYWCLSATSSNPYSGGTYRVYTSQCNMVPGGPGTPAQNWRPWQP
jgi:hypothetical protein